MQHTRIHLKEAESTNDIGSQWLKTAVLGEILSVWTTNQTQGRGQRGNPWDQSPGLDLALTIAVKWPADAPPHDPVTRNKAVTASIRQVIADLLADSNGVRTVGIKWPNDILVQNQAGQWLKCAGILIENTWRGTSWDGMLVGVGVNVNSAHAGEQRRCSLRECLLKDLSIDRVQALMSEHVIQGLQEIDALKNYNEHLVGRGMEARFSISGQPGLGTVEGVNAKGALEMRWRPDGGTVQALTVDQSGTVSWDWLWEK